MRPHHESPIRLRLHDRIEPMARRQSKSQPTWTDVRSKLASLNRTGLLGLIQDLYAAHKDNQTFLHARFDLGEDVLKPYKETIDRWLWPDVLPETGYVCRQSQAGHFQLQEGRWRIRRNGRADGFLLRVRRRVLQRHRQMTTRVTSPRWCVCSSRLSRLRINCRPIAGTPWSPGWIEYVESAKRLAMASETTWISSLRSTGSWG